jgi:site-specific DNA recombinase
MSDAKPVARCAIYTRKSSEEGLEQDFNSLDAQREACEAYVKSQVSEGWVALAQAYNDGGFSGGNLERPALRRLLEDISDGRIDIVVVYKVDRLTRSLADFAKIVEIFDAKAVSFASTTQQFSTTTSMGRLTLNMLLSFAQYERELTGERIRDKLAASKAKGMWMGGPLPLGYDPAGRTLKINEPEAAQVRHIFRRYVELKSVHALMHELEREGFRSKRWTTTAGNPMGGVVMSRGALFHLLSSRLYLGEIPHKERSFPGLHAPIVEPKLFGAVAQTLGENHRRRTTGASRRGQSPLAGRLFDETGQPMSPTIATSRLGRKYRYYVSSRRLRGGARGDGVERIPAVPLENLVRKVLVRLASTSDPSSWAELTPALERLDLRASGAVISLRPAVLAGAHDDAQQALATVMTRLVEDERAWLTDAGAIAVALSMKLVFRGGRSWLTTPAGSDATVAKIRPNRTLIAGLRRGQKLAREARFSPLQGPSALAQCTGVNDPFQRKLVELAFLAPDIQQAILEGCQPAGLTLQQLLATPAPLDWREQRRLWGF